LVKFEKASHFSAMKAASEALQLDAKKYVSTGNGEKITPTNFQLDLNFFSKRRGRVPGKGVRGPPNAS
jgi:hypothetical protein